MHFCKQVRGQCVNARNTHTVQSSRDFIAVFVKLTASTNFGHDHLQSGHTFFFVYIDGNPPAVIFNTNGVVFLDDHIDCGTMTGKGLINRVVDNLIYEVVQSANTHVTDVHGRPHAHVFHPFKGLDITRVVIAFIRIR